MPPRTAREAIQSGMEILGLNPQTAEEWVEDLGEGDTPGTFTPDEVLEGLRLLVVEGIIEARLVNDLIRPTSVT